MCQCLFEVMFVFEVDRVLEHAGCGMPNGFIKTMDL